MLKKSLIVFIGDDNSRGSSLLDLVVSSNIDMLPMINGSRRSSAGRISCPFDVIKYIDLPFVELGYGAVKFHGQFLSQGNASEKICAETHCRIGVYGDDFVGP